VGWDRAALIWLPAPKILQTVHFTGVPLRQMATALFSDFIRGNVRRSLVDFLRSSSGQSLIGSAFPGVFIAPPRTTVEWPFPSNASANVRIRKKYELGSLGLPNLNAFSKNHRLPQSEGPTNRLWPVTYCPLLLIAEVIALKSDPLRNLVLARLSHCCRRGRAHCRTCCSSGTPSAPGGRRRRGCRASRKAPSA
jgi:hypothetical protein